MRLTQETSGGDMVAKMEIEDNRGGQSPLWKGQHRNGRPFVGVRFPQPLFEKILKEATNREWSMAHMIRYLCEASIDGIE